MKKLVLHFFSFCVLSLNACQTKITSEKPNVILIMADDMGYECLGTYGSTSYATPVLDQLASGGIQFENCVSQPLCTPSRVKIMTGMYNYRNYDFFGHLNPNEYTFGNLMKEAGYATCIAGKWQLNGAYHKDEISDWNDNKKPYAFGFDEYCLWQVTKSGSEGGRYANPLIEQNGDFLPRDSVAYGPDIFVNYIKDFIGRKQDQPFFVYYPMVLVHDPFVPTPDSEEWLQTSKNDTTYFKDMVAYTDKIVGQIIDQLKKHDLEKNTILIFTGDNGTHFSINSQTSMGAIQGAKGNTIDAGTHVPLLVSWPKMMKKGSVYEGLIEFSDFFPTLADIVGKEVPSDGQSFLPILKGQEYTARETAFVHYDPQWGKRVNQFRNQFVRTLDYKLYADGKFFNLKKDPLEQHPLHLEALSTEEQNLKAKLLNELKKHPKWNY